MSTVPERRPAVGVLALLGAERAATSSDEQEALSGRLHGWLRHFLSRLRIPHHLCSVQPSGRLQVELAGCPIGIQLKLDCAESYLDPETGALQCRGQSCCANTNEGLPFVYWASRWALQALTKTIGHTCRAREPFPITLADANQGALESILAILHHLAKYANGAAVLAAYPPGSGKSRAALNVLNRLQHGTIAAPNHVLAQEHSNGLLGESRYAQGTLRGLEKANPTLAAALSPAVELGWSAMDYLEEDEKVVCISGSDGPMATVHAFLLVLTAGRRPDPAAPLSPSQKGLLEPPHFIDEHPPFVRSVSLDVRVAGLRINDAGCRDLAAWMAARRAVADLLYAVAVKVAQDWREGALGKDGYPHYIYGHELRQYLLGASGGLSGLKALLRESPYADFVGEANQEICTVLAGEGDEGLLLSVWFPPRIVPAPSPPRHKVRAGQINTRSWPHRDYDSVVLALLGELPELRMVPRKRAKASVVVSGSTEKPMVEFVMRYPWGEDLPPGMHPVVLDATAMHNRSAYQSAFASCPRLLQLDVRVVDRDPAAAERVLIETGQYAFRRTHLAPVRPGRGGQVLYDGVIDSLCRLFDQVMIQVERRPYLHRKVLWVAPKVVKEVIGAAYDMALAAAEGRSLDRERREYVTKQGAERLAAVLEGHIRAGRLEELHLLHQYAASGTNIAEKCSTVVTMPVAPNIGELGEEARVLGIDPIQHIAGVAAAELEQEQHRVRPVRATMEDRKLIVHVDHERPAFWDGRPFSSVKYPEGGPIPAYASLQLAWVIELVMERLGAVSAQLLLWMARHPPFIKEHLGQHVSHAMAGLEQQDARWLQRAVKRQVGQAQAVQAPAPGGGRWTLWERSPGAASTLMDLVVQHHTDLL